MPSLHICFTIRSGQRPASSSRSSSPLFHRNHWHLNIACSTVFSSWQNTHWLDGLRPLRCRYARETPSPLRNWYRWWSTAPWGRSSHQFRSGISRRVQAALFYSLQDRIHVNYSRVHPPGTLLGSVQVWHNSPQCHRRFFRLQFPLPGMVAQMQITDFGLHDAIHDRRLLGWNLN